MIDQKPESINRTKVLIKKNKCTEQWNQYSQLDMDLKDLIRETNLLNLWNKNCELLEHIRKSHGTKMLVLHGTKNI